MKSSHPEILPRKIGAAIIIGFLLLFNLYTLQSSFESMLLQFVVIVALLRIKTVKSFIHDWTGFIVLLLIYSWLRGIADDYAPFKSEALLLVHTAERSLLGFEISGVLQRVFEKSATTFYLSSISYNIYYFMTLVVPFTFWLYKDKFFKPYVYRFAALCGVGLLFFWLIPTAPPWYVSEVVGLGLDRVLYIQGLNASLMGSDFVRYMVSENAVAAFPSFHVAWTVFQVAFLIKNFSKKLWPLLLIPVGVSFSVMYGAEHYIADVLLGTALGLYFALGNFDWFRALTAKVVLRTKATF